MYIYIYISIHVYIYIYIYVYIYIYAVLPIQVFFRTGKCPDRSNGCALDSLARAALNSKPLSPSPASYRIWPVWFDAAPEHV